MSEKVVYFSGIYPTTTLLLAILPLRLSCESIHRSRRAKISRRYYCAITFRHCVNISVISIHAETIFRSILDCQWDKRITWTAGWIGSFPGRSTFCVPIDVSCCSSPVIIITPLWHANAGDCFDRRYMGQSLVSNCSFRFLADRFFFPLMNKNETESKWRLIAHHDPSACPWERSNRKAGSCDEGTIKKFE